MTPSGKLFISGSDDKTIKLFDLQEKQVLYDFEQVHEDAVLCLAVSPDEKHFASGSADKTIKLYDLIQKDEIHHFKDAHKGNSIFEKVNSFNRCNMGSCNHTRWQTINFLFSG